jgi:hypothetical protein
MMNSRKGVSLLSSVAAIAAVAVAGVAGVMTLTGNSVCSMVSGSCGDKAAPAATTIAVSDTSDKAAGGCCPLSGAMADADNEPAARTVEVADDAGACSDAKAKSACSDAQKASCSDAMKASCGESGAAVIAASSDAKAASCSDSMKTASSCDDAKASCGEGGSVVLKAASAKGECGSAMASSCGEPAGNAVTVMAASKRDAMRGQCSVQMFQTRLASFVSLAERVADGCCGGCSGDTCGDTHTVGDAKACADACESPAAASPVASHMVSAGGVVIPALFYNSAKVDHASLENASNECGDAKSECGDKKPAECAGDAKMINASSGGDCGGGGCGEKTAGTEPVAMNG